MMDAANLFGHPESTIILNQNSRRWRQLRRVCCNGLFTRRKLEAMRGQMEEKRSTQSRRKGEEQRIGDSRNKWLPLCDLVRCVLLSFVILYNLISWKTSKLPPGPVGLPVVGSPFHSPFQLGDMPNESLAQLSKRFGPLMSLRLGLKITVVEMAEGVLQKHDQDFVKNHRERKGNRIKTQILTWFGIKVYVHEKQRKLCFLALTDFAGRTIMDAVNTCGSPDLPIIMNQNCPRWRELRRVCNNELFAPKKLEAMRGLREEKV
ncbi:hypothetical protein EJ110_NYTH22462 [Nymphaea thermarum]|nr:hypothetical protein EJ110_NYTH22462 [Nymphaea thermarum]